MSWRLIDDQAPEDTYHIRGLWVYSAATMQPLYWQSDLGYVDEHGAFVSRDGDDYGWPADAYTHWSPLDAPPPKDE